MYLEVTGLSSRFSGSPFSFGGGETPFLFSFSCSAFLCICVLLFFVFFFVGCLVFFFSIMEELTKSWSCLTLSDVEGSQVSIIEEEAVFEFVLAAKFLTKRALNMEAIAKTFTPIWRLKNGFRVTKESDHALLFTFDT